MRRLLSVALLVALAAGPAEAARKRKAAPAPPLDMVSVNEAAPPARLGPSLSPLAVRTAVLLDRARFSPGVVDGRGGENLTKAVKAFQAAEGLPESGTLDEATWAKLSASSAEPALIEYAITPEDVKGPFLEKLPAKMEEMQGLKALGYTSPREMLAERHHMSEALLTTLNRGKDLGQAGTTIIVANVAPAGPGAAGSELKGKATRIEVDKRARTLAALDAAGKVLAFYPASVGSREKPAPSGAHQVQTVAENPTYTYNPDYAFKGVKAARKFDIAGGPNNPVGAVWIDLSVESYGIHGTPEPEKVGRAHSHGCVRLTNWDAQELAQMVKKGTVVEFKD
jgi:lipoprotein-anchoring transpeptidase ErfK/SrfK